MTISIKNRMPDDLTIVDFRAAEGEWKKAPTRGYVIKPGETLKMSLGSKDFMGGVRAILTLHTEVFAGDVVFENPYFGANTYKVGDMGGCFRIGGSVVNERSNDVLFDMVTWGGYCGCPYIHARQTPYCQDLKRLFPPN
ncbi:hypothetical protein [uncultured Bdellovibrio sp.]|uniref:hypothetical protein n=1 Tax=Bdellovibrio sp. HCB-162 TaxID=3394234 RepID=UPI0025DE8A78|nr:hypothetical protein [uncultured Bdellovibrio sp.]